MHINFGKFNLSLGSALGALTSFVGILSDPSVYALLPHKIAVAVTITGVVITSVSKAIVHPASQ